MSENLQLQLKEVEALLATEPENQELQELKTELLEVIELASILKDQTDRAESTENFNTDITENTESTKNVNMHKNEPPVIEDKIKTEIIKMEPKTAYKVGDWCMAQLSDSGQYSPAKIDEITPDGQVTVTFQLYKYQQVTKVSEICEYMKTKFVRGDKERVRQRKRKRRKKHNEEDILLDSSKNKSGSTTNALLGDSTTNALSGESTTNALSGESTTNALSGESTTNALSGESTTNALSGESTTNVLSGESTANALPGESTTNALSGDSTETFKVGYWCMAKSSNNGIHSLAHIDDINSNGQVTVTFKLDKKQEVTTLSEIRKIRMRKRRRPKKKPQLEIENKLLSS